MLSYDDKTIIAQCTPKGSGAIALIRISGLSSISIVSKIAKLSGQKQLEDVSSHTIHFGDIVDEKSNVVDQVMFIVMKSPKTFTGEDVVEITCHNNPFIIEQIIMLVIKHGARLAQPGEFARRAVMNGKIDLLQAEAIKEVIDAQSQQAIKKSLSQLNGSLSNWIEQIESKLIKCLALSEASFEFIDDEIEFGLQIQQEIREIINQVEIAKEKFNNQQHIKEGIRIAIIGAVNAGKSSLFNVLLKKDRAIVSSIAGTTRDSIEAGIYNNDHFLTIVDTAGLRQTDDLIEKEGIKRSFDEAQKADIIILVFDGSRKITQQEVEVYQEIIKLFESKIIKVINKIDLNIDELEFLINGLNVFIKISTKENINIEYLQDAVDLKIKEIFYKADSPFLLNKRQYNLLLDLENKLFEIEKMLINSIDYELLSIHLNEAIASISELTGKNISEKGMDRIFKEFCVGK